MAREQDIFTLVGKQMRRAPGDPSQRNFGAEMPPIAELIRKIDRALLARRAA